MRVALLLLLFASVALCGTRCDWARSFLNDCGFPVTKNTMTAMLGWMQCEGSPCNNNPLDTTEPWAGATNCNSANVKNYPSCRVGLDASKKTLFNGYYGGIINAFKNNQPAMSIAAQIAGSPWGSHCAVSTTEYCAAHYNDCCSTDVHGDC